jgi:hypothetical protein
VGGGFKARVPLAAPTALGGNKRLATLDQVGYDLIGISIPDQCAGWKLDDQIFTISAGFLPALSRLPVLSLELLFMAKIVEGSLAGRDPQHHIAAFTPVTPVRASAWYVFFAPKTDATTATVPGLNCDGRLIDKFHST